VLRESDDQKFFFWGLRTYDNLGFEMSLASFSEASSQGTQYTQCSQLVRALLSWYDLGFDEQPSNFESYPAGMARRMTL
jgi:hypothetical protein